jgi:hypothetical protein
MELHVPKIVYQLSYIPNREKYNKLYKVCQVILKLVSGAVVRSASVRYLTAISKDSNAVAMVTVKWHTDTPLTTSADIMTYTSVFNPLLRSPAQTQLLEFNCLPL